MIKITGEDLVGMISYANYLNDHKVIFSYADVFDDVWNRVKFNVYEEVHNLIYNGELNGSDFIILVRDIIKVGYEN